jgi:hypothetical protein
MADSKKEKPKPKPPKPNDKISDKVRQRKIKEDLNGEQRS